LAHQRQLSEWRTVRVVKEIVAMRSQLPTSSETTYSYDGLSESRKVLNGLYVKETQASTIGKAGYTYERAVHAYPTMVSQLLQLMAI